ncbi:hypothetical protein [Rhodoferax ferrireducens]|uniref:hypothetical protein n=1 Tax=Rhodoferax ferrireducens TaxID=192843 RepID=UPI000E0D5939|nr:hypothetical protein [Rhodoferax ferrireducens]
MNNSSAGKTATRPKPQGNTTMPPTEETKNTKSGSPAISANQEDEREEGRRDPCELADEELEDPDCADKPKPADSTMSSLGLILAMAVAFQLLWFSPRIIRAVANLGQPDERVLLGTVRKVTFIGGFSTATQIDTETQTLLLRGAASLQPGASLERRKGFWDTQACELQTGACWDLLSR